MPLNQIYLSNPSHKKEEGKLKSPIFLALMTLLSVINSTNSIVNHTYDFIFEMLICTVLFGQFPKT